MLDFNEVGRRITMRNAAPGTVPHQAVVEPLVSQLMDPDHTDEAGIVLHTHVECMQLAQTLQRQAMLLDHHEQQDQARDQLIKAQNDELEMAQRHAAELHAQCEELDALVNRYWWQRAWLLGGIVVCAAWLSAVIVAVALVKL